MAVRHQAEQVVDKRIVDRIQMPGRRGGAITLHFVRIIHHLWFRNALEQRYGGVGIEMAGSVGSNETPQVFPTTVSRTPQQFVDASHSAGCRTLFNADQSTMIAYGYYTETAAIGQQLAGAVENAVTKGTVSATSGIEGSRADACFQVTNALFAAAGIAGVFGARPGYADPGCTVEMPLPPSGNTTATYIKTETAAFRIGDASLFCKPTRWISRTTNRSCFGSIHACVPNAPPWP